MIAGTESIERSGVHLHYRIEGTGDSSFLFVHGWCCDHTFFQPQFDHFKSDHSVVAVDLRGCGRSDRPNSGYDMATMADDVAWLCRELGLSRPVLVGHSLGGSIALELAAREPSIPGAVIVVEPGPIHPTPEARSFLGGFIDQLEGPDGEGVRRAFIENMVPSDNNHLARKIIDTMIAIPLDVAVAMLRGILDWNGVAAFLLCRVPMLLLRAQIGGSNDPSRLLALKPDIHVGVTVGAGHFHQLEVPDQVNAMMERFLARMNGITSRIE